MAVSVHAGANAEKMTIRDENTALIRYFHRMLENAPLQTPWRRAIQCRQESLS